MRVLDLSGGRKLKLKKNVVHEDAPPIDDAHAFVLRMLAFKAQEFEKFLDAYDQLLVKETFQIAPLHNREKFFGELKNNLEALQRAVDWRLKGRHA